MLRPEVPGFCVREKDLPVCVADEDCDQGLKCVQLGREKNLRFCLAMTPSSSSSSSSISIPIIATSTGLVSSRRRLPTSVSSRSHVRRHLPLPDARVTGGLGRFTSIVFHRAMANSVPKVPYHITGYFALLTALAEKRIWPQIPRNVIVVTSSHHNGDRRTLFVFIQPFG